LRTSPCSQHLLLLKLDKILRECLCNLLNADLSEDQWLQLLSLFEMEVLVSAVFRSWPCQPFWLLITLHGSSSCRYWEAVSRLWIWTTPRLSLCGAMDFR